MEINNITSSTSSSTTCSDLFDNPMTKAAMKALSQEDIERYKKLGESLYGDIDFEATTALNNMPPPMAEAVAYVTESIKSGLHPSMLDENEVALLIDAYGEKWYEKWGYQQDDLKEIQTLVQP